MTGSTAPGSSWTWAARRRRWPSCRPRSARRRASWGSIPSRWRRSSTRCAATGRSRSPLRDRAVAKPVLLSVDDDRDVLGAIERDLRRHYGEQYRVVTASSGAEALEALRQLQRRLGSVALLLVDQRMPGMTGVEFLREARKLYPDALRVLLTAY